MMDYEKLKQAILNDDTAVMKEIVKGIKDINELDEYGYPLLSYACEGGSVSIVKMLLAKGADAGQLYTQHHNHLTLTALSGMKNQAEILKLLLDKNVAVDIRGYNDNTALIEASFIGNLECMKLLIAKEADLNAKNVKGNTPLISAAKNGHYDAVKLLIDSGVLLHGKGNSRIIPANRVHPLLGNSEKIETNDAADKTALDMAEQRGHTKIVQLLKTAMSITGKPAKEAIKLNIQKTEEMITESEKSPEEVLRWAIASGKTENVKKILDLGTKVTEEIYDYAAEFAASKTPEVGVPGRAIMEMLYEVKRKNRK